MIILQTAPTEKIYKRKIEIKMKEPLTPIGNDRLLLVNLPKTYPDGIKKDDFYKRENLYEKVRKYWKVDKERAKHADYVLGVYKGEVVAVFEPSDWIEVEDKDKFTGKRCMFICDNPNPIEDTEYLHKDASKYLKGQNPVRYINC